jgi:hypothetical protein
MAFWSSRFVSLPSHPPYYYLPYSSHGQDVYTYNFTGDRKLLKLLGTQSLHRLHDLLNDHWYKVYTIFLLETIQTAFTGADLYYWFVSGFGNINHLQSPYLSSFDVPIIGSVVSLAVQFFFAYRVWVLSDKKSSWLCVIICIVSQSQISDLRPINNILHRLVLSC